MHARRRAGAVLAMVVALTTAIAGPVEAGSNELGGVEQIAAGQNMTCAVLADTTVRCWGRGPLGRGEPVSARSNMARTVLDLDGEVLSGAEQVAVGLGHACVLLGDSSVRCWGKNSSGQVGDGSQTTRLRPVAVQARDGSALTGVVAIAAGGFHSCALLASGEVRCWGQNGGAVGDGTAKDRKRAVQVLDGAGTGPLTGVSAIVAGSTHTCARIADGRVRCWGDNRRAQLGDGTLTRRLLPRLVRSIDGNGSLTGVTHLTSSHEHTCARVAGAQARCWGPNEQAQLGDDAQTPPGQPPRTYPRVVKAASVGALTGVDDVGVGFFHSCAIVDAAARCWAMNNEGQTGDGTRLSPRRLPRTVKGVNGVGALTGVSQIVGAALHTCALLEGGSVACWGNNAEYQVGNGSTAPRQITARLVVTG